MPKVNLLSERWCNLVFENRNKEYGAYVLRRDGGKHLTCALIIVVIIFVLFAVFPLVFWKLEVKFKSRQKLSTVANLSKLDPPKIHRPRNLKAVDITQRVMAKKEKNAIKFVPQISEDEESESQLLLGAENIGVADLAYDEIDTAVSDSLLMKDTVSQSEPKLASGYPSPVEVVEEMPQFPGGLSGLMKWLDKNVVYPPACIRNKIAGRVEVSFYVSEKGKVIEPKVVKKVHPLLDREGLLTVMKMPEWTPGKVNGKVSVVRITIPIEFVLR